MFEPTAGTLPPPPPPPEDAGTLVEYIFFTLPKPAAIIAAAETKPNIPPCAKALFAPVYVSIIADAAASSLLSPANELNAPAN